MESIKKGEYKDIILSIDEENNKCVDCGKENPSKVSVNHGIILCEGCAAEHIQLGPTISFIRDLSEEFDEYLLNYFTLGGNSKFKKFLKEENVDLSLPINQKYLTKACDFYRINLKRKVQGDKLKEKNYENPNELLENPENNFPEFENYVIKNASQGNKTKMDQAKKVLGNIGSNLFSFGKKMYSGVKQGANYVATKAQPATNQIKKGAVFMGHQEEENNENKNNDVNNGNGEEQKQEEPKIEEKKENENENGPGILLNQPLGNVQVQEQNSS